MHVTDLTEPWFHGYRCDRCGAMRDEGDGFPPEPCDCYTGPRWHHYSLIVGAVAEGPRAAALGADDG